MVGAPFDTIGPNLDQGSAYVFKRSGTVWTQLQKLIASDGGNDVFGVSVALDADTLVAGAPWGDIGANENQGSVYVFYRPPCGGLALMPASLPNGSIYSGYNQWVRVNSPGNYQFTVSSGALPPGLTLSSDGLLSGAPTMLGAYQFTITTTDLTGSCYISRDYTITIDSCFPLTIDPPELHSGRRGTWYTEILTVTDGVYPFTFSKSGALPPGLKLSLDGVISGVPTQTGLFNFTATARDALGCVGSRSYSILITRPGIEIDAARQGRVAEADPDSTGANTTPIASFHKLMIGPPVLPDGLAGASYSETLMATGGIAPYTFHLLGELPTGLSLSATGVLSGAPKLDGNYNFRVAVKDANGCVAKSDFSIRIKKSEIGIFAAPRVTRSAR